MCVICIIKIRYVAAFLPLLLMLHRNVNFVYKHPSVFGARNSSIYLYHEILNVINISNAMFHEAYSPVQTINQQLKGTRQIDAGFISCVNWMVKNRLCDLGEKHPEQFKCNIRSDLVCFLWFEQVENSNNIRCHSFTK